MNIFKFSNILSFTQLFPADIVDSLQDPRWNDVNVISSLLKSFFRKLPDSLFTSELYPHFIASDKLEDPNARFRRIRKLVSRHHRPCDREKFTTADNRENPKSSKSVNMRTLILYVMYSHVLTVMRRI